MAVLLVLVCACFFIYLVPKKFQTYILLCASVGMFLLTSPSALIYTAVITGTSFLVGRRLEKKRSKKLLGGFIVFLILVLAILKYTAPVLSFLQINAPSIVIPLGLSYYSLMIIGYLIEVYRGTQEAEKNIGSYALFVNFFPQVIAGPIGRIQELRPQYERGSTFDLSEVRAGFAMVMFGLFEKMVLADNLNKLVTGIYQTDQRGLCVILAMLVYSLVIYFDFAGYSLIAIGGARMLGIRLMTNFNAPYRAVTVQEFWRRWHISLSSWFRDYVYIPLGGNRKGEIRRDVNTIIVFVLSGAWHGGGTGYLLWGALHGIYQVVAKRTKEIRDQWFGEFRKKERFVWLQRLTVYVLVSLAWVPFCVGSLWGTWRIWRRMFGLNPWVLTDGTLLAYLDFPTIILCVLGGLAVFAVDRYQQKKDFFLPLARENVLVRYGIYTILFLGIVLAGVYGDVYEESQFIYGQF